MNGRNLVILLIVAVVLGIAYYLISQDEADPVTGIDPDATAIPTSTPPIALVKETTIDDVLRLEVTRLEDDLQVAFERQEDGSWFQVVPTNTVVISGTMNSNVTRLVNMTSQSSLDADANPLSAYGLDAPQYEIVLVARRGENNARHIFLIGNKTPTNDRYYAQKQGDPRIHVLLSSTVETFINLLDERPIPTPTPETADTG